MTMPFHLLAAAHIILTTILSVMHGNPAAEAAGAAAAAAAAAAAGAAAAAAAVHQYLTPSATVTGIGGCELSQTFSSEKMMKSGDV